MPSCAASAYVTEQRWPVTLSPRACAASIAAPSSARVMFMYALNDVAPMSAQYSTCRRASAASFSARIWRNVLGPFRYGAVASIAGPGCWPASIISFSFTSITPLVFPPVLIVVTPPARYKRTKLSPRFP